MRIDNALDRDGYTSVQLFFLECWLNLCHRESLDSDRVTYLNSSSGLQELIELYEFGGQFRAPEKRITVAEELHSVLKEDIILNDIKYSEIKTILIGFFDINKLKNGNHSIDSSQKLINSYAKQLISLMEINYRIDCITKLRDILINDDLSDLMAKEISTTCNYLMSYLVSSGVPLSECYTLYKFILTEKGKKFEDCFERFSTKVTKENELFTLELTISCDKLDQFLKRSEKVFSLNGCQFSYKENSILVITCVSAISIYSARNIAEKLVIDAMDIMGYMFSKENMTIAPKFTGYLKENGYRRSIKYSNIISNPSDDLTDDEFSSFIESVNNLLQTSANESEKKKITDAFRLYKDGATAATKESSFVSYWSTLEALTLGISSNELSHEEHVIFATIPCIGIDYVVKKIRAASRILKVINIADYSNKTTSEAYSFLKHKQTQSDIYNSLQGKHPYIAFKMKSFFDIISDPYKLSLSILGHENKVCQQLKRLYRVRNSIVHNATSVPNLALLNANLEHYLRCCLNSMFAVMNRHSTISSTTEAFIRYHHYRDIAINQMNPSLLESNANKRKTLIKQIEEGDILVSDEKLIDLLTIYH